MYHLRHHKHEHLHLPFGNDWFGSKAEKFARFFGTPYFIVGQTVIVAAWILWNIYSGVPFDPYPFIFLNLTFSLQAAYASPFILLAQTRQADRDRANTDADAKHREELAQVNTDLQKNILSLLDKNTQLTERVESLTSEVHKIIKVKND